MKHCNMNASYLLAYQVNTSVYKIANNKKTLIAIVADLDKMIFFLILAK